MDGDLLYFNFSFLFTVFFAEFKVNEHLSGSNLVNIGKITVSGILRVMESDAKWHGVTDSDVALAGSLSGSGDRGAYSWSPSPLFLKVGYVRLK